MAVGEGQDDIDFALDRLLHCLPGDRGERDPLLLRLCADARARERLPRHGRQLRHVRHGQQVDA